MRLIKFIHSATVLLSAAAQAQNLVTNGDFETLHNPITGEAISTGRAQLFHQQLVVL